jgi:hypothetical protein
MIITHLRVHCNNASKYFPLKVYLSARIKDDLLDFFLVKNEKVVQGLYKLKTNKKRD